MFGDRNVRAQGCRRNGGSHPPALAGVIRTTPNHPFYVRGRGWLQGRDLRIGDRFRGADGGEFELIDIDETGVIEPVFNIHVDTFRTYLRRKRRRA